jgi:hypothetical protein
MVPKAGLRPCTPPAAPRFTHILFK